MSQTLLDSLMPTFDVVERHGRTVRAPIDATWAALFTTDFASSGILRALLGLRALPGVLLQGPAGWNALRARSAKPITLSTLESSGFTRIAERPPTELVFGVQGKFWTISAARCTLSATDFLDTPPHAGTARAAWNFELSSESPGVTRVTTETRVLCADAHARRRFLPYWAVVRPGSGIIRHAMLNRLREHAEDLNFRQ
ncbi:MAG: hypothetical protein JWO05_962 [Gemmatimonadetes bacterium]|nr:hypothetical protein [Gemmatimonadota bacterium]